MRTSISSHGALVCSIHTLLLKYNNMSKIRDNYLAELIIILVIATMLLSSCQQETECMYANQVENCDEVD
jgi:hypothetical protein